MKNLINKACERMAGGERKRWREGGRDGGRREGWREEGGKDGWREEGRMEGEICLVVQASVPTPVGVLLILPTPSLLFLIKYYLHSKYTDYTIATTCQPIYEFMRETLFSTASYRPAGQFSFTNVLCGIGQ